MTDQQRYFEAVLLRVHARMRRDLEQPSERTKGPGQLVDAFVGDRHDDDACELAGQFGHLAALPVATVGSHNLGKSRHQAGTIVTDGGEHDSWHTLIVSTDQDHPNGLTLLYELASAKPGVSLWSRRCD